eukprot:gene10068-2489_t
MNERTIRAAEIAARFTRFQESERQLSFSTIANERDRMVHHRNHKTLTSRLKKIKQFAAGHLMFNFAASPSTNFTC